MNDRELMRIRADTLFTHDDRGRMLCSNEPREAERRFAPRLFLGHTPAGHVLRLSATVPDDVARQLSAIIATLPPVADVLFPSSLLTAVRETLARHAAITAEGGGPAYRFPPTITPPAGAVPLTDANRALVRETNPWLYHELADWRPCYAVVRGGTAVSVCFSARMGTVAAEAGVETLPAFRGRGYAGAVTAAWGAAIRASGRIPLYSTAWENRASQSAARRAGLIMFGADWTLT